MADDLSVVARPLRRRGIQRLAREQWGSGRSIWSADSEDRELVVDQIEVHEEEADNRVSDALAIPAGARVWVRSRRFVLEGKPVLFAMSFLPSDIVADSAVTQVDTGPGGTYGWPSWGTSPSTSGSGPGCRQPTRPSGFHSPWAHR